MHGAYTKKLVLCLGPQSKANRSLPARNINTQNKASREPDNNIPPPSPALEKKKCGHIQNKPIECVLTATLTKVDVKQNVSGRVTQSGVRVQRPIPLSTDRTSRGLGASVPAIVRADVRLRLEA